MVNENWHISAAGFKWITRRYRIIKPMPCPKGRDWIRRNAGKFKRLKERMFNIFSYRCDDDAIKARRFLEVLLGLQVGSTPKGEWGDRFMRFLNKRERIGANLVWLYPMIAGSLLVLHTANVEKYFYARAPLHLSWGEYINMYIGSVKSCLRIRDGVWVAMYHGMAEWVAQREDMLNNHRDVDDIPF